MDKNFITLNNGLLEITKQFREQFLEIYQGASTQDWIDGPEQGQKFSSSIGKDFYQKAQKIQQKLILAGDTTQWDLPMFINVYKTLKPGKRFFRIHNIHEEIKKIRNQLAHHSTFQMSDSEFNIMWSNLNKYLEDLDLDTETFQKIKNSQIDSKEEQKLIIEDEKYINQLNQAHEAFKNKNYQTTISILGLLLNNQQISIKFQEEIYLLRCQTYYEIYKLQPPQEKNDDTLLNAICDGKIVLRTNPNSYQAYFVMGQCFQNLNQLEKAQEYLRKCKIMDNNNELKEIMASIALKIEWQTNDRSFDPRNFPKTIDEQREEILKQLQITDKQLNSLEKFRLMIDPDLDIIFKAHEYRDGSKKIDQNYEIAVQYYSKLSHKKNAEAMFNLGRLMIEGKGTKKDIKRGITLIEEVAQLPPTKSFMDLTYPNVGVLEAQQSLGTWYYRGIYFDQDYSLAKKWFEKSLTNGCERAANDLGLLYLHGEGVERDFDKAEQYFLIGHERGDHNSAYNLTCLYLAVGDYQKLQKYQEIALKQGHFQAKSRDKEIKESITLLKSQQKFVQQKLFSSPLLNYLVPQSQLLVFQDKFDQQILQQHVNLNSKQAIAIQETVQFYLKGLSYLNKLEQEGSLEQMINNFASAVSLEEYVCSLQLHQTKIIIKVIEQILELNERSQLDENARIVRSFLYFSMDKGQICINFYKECIKLYPKQVHFYKALGQYYAKSKKFEEGLNWIEKAVKLDPNNYSIQYNVGPMLRILGSNERAIDEYNRYLLLAPKDERKVPESLYSIANCYLAMGEKKNANLIKEYYKKGIKAESLQLPFFLPYQSVSKQCLEFYMNFGVF